MAYRPPFELEIADRGSHRTVKLAGELDSSTCGALTDALKDAASNRELVLDLQHLSFIDSAGMRAVIMFEREARDRGLTLVVLPPPAPVADLLRTAGVSERLKLLPSTSDEAPPSAFLERIEVELPSHPTTPARARSEVRQALELWLSSADRDAATLLTSELVTNAVIHPQRQGGPIGLRLVSYEDRIRVEISDPGAGFDPKQLPVRRGEASDSGAFGNEPEVGRRGLFIVDSLASRWGTRTEEGRFCVWFELGVDDPGSVAASGS